MSRLVSLFKLLSIILCKIWIVLWIHGHNGVTVAFDYGDNQDNHAHILSPDDNTTLSSSRSHHHHHHQHFHHEHSLKVNSTHDQKPKPKKPQFAVMTNWTFAPCQVDPALEKLVHNNGTRTLLLMYYHNAFSESVVRKYTRCHPWMIPVLVKRSVYMESSVYRDYFQHRMKHFLLKADYIITSTYKHVPVIDGDVKPENQTVGPITPLTLDFIHNLIKTAHENNYDVLPIERFPYVNIYDSLIPNHGVPSVAAWRNLLTRLGFSLDDLSYCRFIFPFWRSAFLIRPSVMARLVRLMTRCMDVVDNDKLVTPSFRRDARYQRGNPEVAMQVFGTKFYQMHPFIFERLPAFFLASMNASVPNLTSSEYRPPKGISVSLQKDLGWI